MGYKNPVTLPMYLKSFNYEIHLTLFFNVY